MMQHPHPAKHGVNTKLACPKVTWLLYKVLPQLHVEVMLEDVAMVMTEQHRAGITCSVAGSLLTQAAALHALK